jgi:hypothetical protein
MNTRIKMVRHTAFKTMPVLAALLYCSMGFSTSHALTGTLNGLTSDGQVGQVGTVKSVVDTTAQHSRIGSSSADAKQLAVIHVFQIPSALLTDHTQRFDTATYSTRLTAVGATRNADLYGLGYRTGSALLATDYYVGTADASATLIKDNFIVPSVANYTAVSASGVALTDYLNAQLIAARAAGATSAYVFFRTNLEASVSWQSYQLGMTEAGGGNIPTLAYTTAPIAAEPIGTVIMISSVGGQTEKTLSQEQRKQRPKTDEELARQKTPNA